MTLFVMCFVVALAGCSGKKDTGPGGVQWVLSLRGKLPEKLKTGEPYEITVVKNGRKVLVKKLESELWLPDRPKDQPDLNPFKGIGPCNWYEVLERPDGDFVNKEHPQLLVSEQLPDGTKLRNFRKLESVGYVVKWTYPASGVEEGINAYGYLYQTFAVVPGAESEKNETPGTRPTKQEAPAQKTEQKKTSESKPK